MIYKYILKGHNGAVNSIVVSSDGRKIVTSSDDKSIKIWDANNFKLLKTLEGQVKDRYNGEIKYKDGILKYIT